jgi:hypothetical protein
MASRDHKVLSFAFLLLNDIPALTELSDKACDPVARLIAAHKIGRPWRAIFRAASADARLLRDAISALVLFPTDDAATKSAVDDLCFQLIRRGDETFIPELRTLLELYGDKSLAQSYVNSGDPKLNSAGSIWATKHGFRIIPVPDPYSSGSAWGSGR